MITNILATILITVTTNIMPIRQYAYPCTAAVFPPCTQDHWTTNNIQSIPPNWIVKTAQENSSGIIFSPDVFNSAVKERDDPDNRLLVITEIKNLTFIFEGKEYTLEVSKKVLETITQSRVVIHEESWVNTNTISAAKQNTSYNTGVYNNLGAVGGGSQNIVSGASDKRNNW